MTLFDYQQFNKIRPWELLDNNFMKKETSPNIAFIADRFSQVYRPEYDAFNLETNELPDLEVDRIRTLDNA